RPRRSRKAEAAMRNPKCGYDFISKLYGDNDGNDGGAGTTGPADGGGTTFLQRMDEATHSQRQRLERQRAEEAYAACLDKKRCPGCGAEQTYDEVRGKRTACQNCNLEYRSAAQWRRRDWEQRSDKYADEATRRRKELEETVL
ncbi:unnamed protein product, partial [Phaeothamnion confervicola]